MGAPGQEPRASRPQIPGYGIPDGRGPRRTRRRRCDRRGAVERLTPPADDVVARVVEGFAKYRQPYDYEVDPHNWLDGGLWELSPKVAFGWNVGLYPADATRWHF
jgi:hypothetical protein